MTPITEGGPVLSPERLPGEPSDTPRAGFQPVTSPLLETLHPLFSRSLLITT